VRHHHPDPGAKVLLVKAEGLGTFAGEIHVRVHLHGVISIGERRRAPAIAAAARWISA
jgi:hypothetical protein